LTVAALTRLRARTCILDGEAVVCGDDGLALFELVRHWRNAGVSHGFGEFLGINVHLGCDSNASRSAANRSRSCFASRTRLSVMRFLCAILAWKAGRLPSMELPPR